MLPSSKSRTVLRTIQAMGFFLAVACVLLWPFASGESHLVDQASAVGVSPARVSHQWPILDGVHLGFGIALVALATELWLARAFRRRSSAC